MFYLVVLWIVGTFLAVAVVGFDEWWKWPVAAAGIAFGMAAVSACGWVWKKIKATTEGR